MPTNADDAVLCWGCGQPIPNEGSGACPCGHTAGLFEKIGFDPERCPDCESHLRNGICLNGCSLGKAGMARFQKLMQAAARAAGKDEK